MGMVGASQNGAQMDAVCAQSVDQRARKLLIFLKSEQLAGQARLIGHDDQRVAARLQEATQRYGAGKEMEILDPMRITHVLNQHTIAIQKRDAVRWPHGAKPELRTRWCSGHGSAVISDS